jgi:hypothetical protein
VAGQEHGRTVASGILGDEPANPPLRRDVQPQRRLVQKEHPRPVQQCPGQLALHPLAKGEIAHRLRQQRTQVEQFAQLISCLAELVLGDAEDGAVELEGVGDRNVPEKLVALPHHQRYLAQIGLVPLPGDMTEDRSLTARRIEQTGEHLERGRLAGPVRPQKPDHLARRDVERDAVDCDHLFGLATKDGANGGAQTRFPLRDVIGLTEIANLNRWQNEGSCST